jgi:nucleoside-diphosphate-sugar epimerase
MLHFAYLMRHLANELGHDEFVRRNLAITDTTVRALEAVRPASFAFASSGAVYRPDGGIVDDLEHDPYATLKHRDELAFERACSAVGTRCVIGRIYSVGGPFMPDRDRFVLGDLVDRTVAGRPLVIRARHELWRSYAALGDVLAVLLAESLAGTEPVVRFDTGGEVVEAGELAERVRTVLGAPQVVIERDPDPTLAPDRYVGDGTGFAALARRHGVPLTSLDDQIRQVARA